MDVLSYGVLGLGYQTLFVQGRGAGGFPPKTHGPFRFFRRLEFKGVATPKPLIPLEFTLFSGFAKSAFSGYNDTYFQVHLMLSSEHPERLNQAPK